MYVYVASEEFQLGHYDIPAAAIHRPGISLVDVLNTLGVTWTSDFHTPPAGGWRLIVGDPSDPATPLTVFAAPWPTQAPSAWMILESRRADGKVHVLVDTSG